MTYGCRTHRITRRQSLLIAQGSAYCRGAATHSLTPLCRSNTQLSSWPALSPADSTRAWLADRVLLKIIYVLVRRLLSLAVLMFRCDSAKDAELLVLRHDNAVLSRHAGRARYEPADRG